MHLVGAFIAMEIMLAALVFFLFSDVPEPEQLQYASVDEPTSLKRLTYKWNQTSDAQCPSRVVDGHIKQAVEVELARDGFTMTESDNPDLYVTLQIATNPEKQRNG